MWNLVSKTRMQVARNSRQYIYTSANCIQGGLWCLILMGKPEGKRTPGRPRSRWVDNIRMDLQEVGCG